MFPTGDPFQRLEMMSASATASKMDVPLLLMENNVTSYLGPKQMWVESVSDADNSSSRSHFLNLSSSDAAESLFASPTDVKTPDDEMNSEEMQFLFFFAYGIVGPLIIVFGLIGNGLTLKTLFGRTPVWTNGATYTYLQWLAITDTGALVMAIPMEVRLSMPWRKLAYWEAFYQAHLELPVLNAFMGSSIFIVVCLTCTRFMALFQPTEYWSSSSHGSRNNGKARLAVLLAIVLAAALSAPLVLLKQVVCTDGTFCKPKENTGITGLNAWKAFVITSEAVVRVLPVLVLTVLNIAMIFKFRSVLARRRRAISTRSNSRADAARADERRKLTLLSTIIICFVCFNSPSAVLSIIYSESWENRRGFEIFRAISNDCELANFAINFYAYCLCSNDFRRAFVAALPGNLAQRFARTRRRRRENNTSRGLLGHFGLIIGRWMSNVAVARDITNNNGGHDFTITSDSSRRNSSPPSLRTEIGRNAFLVSSSLLRMHGDLIGTPHPAGCCENIELKCMGNGDDEQVQQIHQSSYSLDREQACPSPC